MHMRLSHPGVLGIPVRTGPCPIPAGRAVGWYWGQWGQRCNGLLEELGLKIQATGRIAGSGSVPRSPSFRSLSLPTNNSARAPRTLVPLPSRHLTSHRRACPFHFPRRSSFRYASFACTTGPGVTSISDPREACPSSSFRQCMGFKSLSLSESDPSPPALYTSYTSRLSPGNPLPQSCATCLGLVPMPQTCSSPRSVQRSSAGRQTTLPSR